MISPTPLDVYQQRPLYVAVEGLHANLGRAPTAEEVYALRLAPSGACELACALHAAWLAGDGAEVNRVLFEDARAVAFDRALRGGR